MMFYPVRVTKRQQYTVYVEAIDEDDALEVAAARLRHAASLVDDDPTDDYTIKASVETDERREPVETDFEALAAKVTYVVDHNGKDVKE
ncbi:MAG: hypothetical protein WAY93_10380 [Atopobiaceae bacterium]|jgi:hypothetical protein|nr:hypothetical protein [Atopobiaceae bacterium]